MARKRAGKTGTASAGARRKPWGVGVPKISFIPLKMFRFFLFFSS